MKTLEINTVNARSALVYKTDITAGDELSLSCWGTVLGTAFCADVLPIEIKTRSFGLLGGKPLGFGGIDQVAKNCGFVNSDELKPNLPFVGFLVLTNGFKKAEDKAEEA